MAISDENGIDSAAAQDRQSLILTQLFQKLIVSFPTPFRPPPCPKTSDEALVMLSKGGKNVLAKVDDFLFHYRELLREGWKDETPNYVKGFGALADWVASIMDLGLDLDRLVGDALILDTEKMHDFARAGRFQLCIEQIDNLRSSISEISQRATICFRYDNYFSFLAQLIEAELLKMVHLLSTLADDARVDKLLKNMFYYLFVDHGVFKVHFFEIIRDGKLSEIICQDFREDLTALSTKFFDTDISFCDIILFLKELSGKEYLPGQKVNSPTRSQPSPKCTENRAYGSIAILQRIERLIAHIPSGKGTSADKVIYKERSLYRQVVAALVWLTYNHEGKFSNHEIRNEIMKPHTSVEKHLKPSNAVISRVKRYLEQACGVTFVTKSHNYRPTNEGLKILEKELESLDISLPPKSS